MTVTSTTARVDYLGNGVATTFAYPFRIFSPSDLRVVTRDTAGVERVLALGTDYTVNTSAGSITLTAALADGYTLTIRRVLEIKQGTSFRSNGSFFPGSHEDALDRLTMMAQQQQDELDRAMRLPETVAPDEVSTALPVPAPNRLLGWNNAGTALEGRQVDGSAIVLPGAGRTVPTVSAYLGNNADYNPRDWSAKGNDIDDDTAALKAAAAASVGDRLVIRPGVYKIADAISIPAGTRLVMLPGAILKQYDETKPVIKVNADGVTLDNPVVRYATTATRRTSGAIEIVAANDFLVVGGEIQNSSGLGLYIARAIGGSVHGMRCRDTLADGFHVTNGGAAGHVSKGIRFFGCRAQDTGDDTFAVISYAGAGQAICEDVEFHGCRSLRSGARGFALAGKGLRVFGGSVLDCTGSGGLYVYLDEAFNTFNPEDVQVYGLRIAAATGAPASNRFGVWVYRARNVKLHGMVVDGWGGGDADVKINGTAGDYSQDVELASCRIAGVQTTGSHLLFADRVRRLRVHHTKFGQGYKQAWFVSNYEDVRITDNEVAEVNYQNSAANHLASFSNGATYTDARRNSFAHTARAITHGIQLSTVAGPIYTRQNDFTGVTVAASGQLLSITNAASTLDGMSADRGDADVTLTVGVDCESQRFATPLTTNRAITLAAAGASHGAKFRIVRLSSATGASTLTVLGVALAVSQWAEVEYDGRAAAWRLVAKGALT